jgi:GNAT superfamily N-acetyltransferase
MPVEILSLNRESLRPVVDELAEVYRLAFSQPPYNEKRAEGNGFASRLRFHSLRNGFRCFMAREMVSDTTVGFAYGYNGGSGLWWFDLVNDALTREDVHYWLADYFEFVELAVIPDYQGQRIGSQLHDRLLAGLAQRTAVLSTIQSETRAMQLYTRRGWTPIAHNVHFPGDDFTYIIMGLELHKKA